MRAMRTWGSMNCHPRRDVIRGAARRQCGYRGFADLLQHRGISRMAGRLTPRRDRALVPLLARPWFRLPRRFRLHGIIRPVVLRVSTAHLLPDIEVRRPPEASEIARHLHRAMRRRQEMNRE